MIFKKPALPSLYWSSKKRPEKAARAHPRRGGIPNEPGVYCIFGLDPLVLVYVGESGRSESTGLRDRIRGQWADVNHLDPDVSQFDDEREEALVKNRSHFDGGYVVCWASDSNNPVHDLLDTATRRACESWICWWNRVHTGLSTIANHARSTHDGCTLVIGIGKHADGPGLAPTPKRRLRLRGDPLSVGWMDLTWTPFFRFNELKHRPPPDSVVRDPRIKRYGPALYRVADPSHQELLMIGCRKHAENGSRNVLRSLPDGARVSWCSFPMSIYTYECLELTSDLIGVYYHQVRRPPKYQSQSDDP